MKGFIIFEDFKKLIKCKEILDGDYNCVISDYPNGTFSGIINRVTGATCNKDDTYDFEVGALISLMKMCGRDKVTKACDELYKDDNYKNALQEMTENNKKLIEENNYLKYVISCRESVIESLENTRDLLIDKNNELIEENRKRKLDCEKLQHGYNDIMFCGGRQNGKQYTALVELFKKIDQKKVDAAYKEAYNTTLPVWQKEVLNQMYGIYKESKEKIELQGFHIEVKQFTKREEMWENILNASKNPPVDIKVAKQDIKAFLKELQDKIPEARWNGSDCLLTEYTNPYWFNHDYIYFALFRKDDKGYIKTCYDECKHNWINKPVIDYLPPMRWDLFKKGRLAVKVTYNNYKDFYEACEKEFGKKPSTYPMPWEDVTISICKKDGNFEIFTMEHQKKTGRKIVDWEDVR